MQDALYPMRDALYRAMMADVMPHVGKEFAEKAAEDVIELCGELDGCYKEISDLEEKLDKQYEKLSSELEDVQSEVDEINRKLPEVVDFVTEILTAVEEYSVLPSDLLVFLSDLQKILKFARSGRSELISRLSRKTNYENRLSKEYKDVIQRVADHYGIDRTGTKAEIVSRIGEKIYTEDLPLFYKWYQAV